MTDTSKGHPFNKNKITSLYFNEIKKHPILSAKQERRYIRLAQRGSQRAKELVITSNLKLAISIAMNYTNRGVNLLDIISEGNLGLFKAIDKFDTTMGFRFSTYATWWIKQSIESSLARTSRTIRLPSHIIAQLYKFRKVERKFIASKNRTPNLSELANALKTNEKNIQNKIESLPKVQSLESIHEQSGNALQDIIPAKKQEEPDNILYKKEKKRNIENLLNNLTKTQKEVICHRFGLLGYPPSTLEYISKHIGKTRERVRQIQVESISKLNNIMKKKPNKFN
jgi:RNA polymerase nonessential primary-like sigma factor